MVVGSSRMAARFTTDPLAPAVEEGQEVEALQEAPRRLWPCLPLRGRSARPSPAGARACGSFGAVPARAPPSRGVPCSPSLCSSCLRSLATCCRSCTARSMAAIWADIEVLQAAASSLSASESWAPRGPAAGASSRPASHISARCSLSTAWTWCMRQPFLRTRSVSASADLPPRTVRCSRRNCSRSSRLHQSAAFPPSSRRERLET
mmetsp:Transcript_76953/g.217744  ORF Transcript_76953/g.217744 Transcript_76953/m.217744 type:complete len:206 (+) Transcript_76953:303-920(+)